MSSAFEAVLAELDDLRRREEVLLVAVRQYAEQDPPGRMIATFEGRLVDLADRGRTPATVYWAVFGNRFAIHLFAPYGVQGRWVGDGQWEVRTYQVLVGDVLFELTPLSEYERREAFLREQGAV